MKTGGPRRNRPSEVPQPRWLSPRGACSSGEQQPTTHPTGLLLEGSRARLDLGRTIARHRGEESALDWFGKIQKGIHPQNLPQMLFAGLVARASKLP